MRKVKELIVDQICEDLKDVQAGIFVNYQGLTTEEVNELRQTLRDQNVHMRVYKNTLTRIALTKMNLGTKNSEHEEKIFNLPTAVVFGENAEEPTDAAKAFDSWQKDRKKKLEIKGGFYGEELLGSDAVKVYIDLPDRQTLLAQVASVIASPLTGFAGVTSGVLQKFAGTVDALREKKEEGDG